MQDLKYLDLLLKASPSPLQVSPLEHLDSANAHMPKGSNESIIRDAILKEGILHTKSNTAI